MATKRQHINARFAQWPMMNRWRNHQDEELCLPRKESTHTHEHKVFTDDYDQYLIKDTTDNICQEKIKCQHAKSSPVWWKEILLPLGWLAPKEYINRGGMLMKKAEL
jgi:hypothetical protein